ncbi:MAG: hypothetical protein VB131_08385 [Burkholderia gladioli]
MLTSVSTDEFEREAGPPWPGEYRFCLLPGRRRGESRVAASASSKSSDPPSHPRCPILFFAIALAIFYIQNAILSDQLLIVGCVKPVNPGVARDGFANAFPLGVT